MTPPAMLCSSTVTGIWSARDAGHPASRSPAAGATKRSIIKKADCWYQFRRTYPKKNKFAAKALIGVPGCAWQDLKTRGLAAKPSVRSS
jgi:hypothetical protein